MSDTPASEYGFPDKPEDKPAQQVESAIKTDETDRCLNCDTPLVDKYCHVCGQNSHYQRLEMRQVLGELFHSLVSLDSRFFRTFLGLCVRPGTVCREYVEGKRQRYTNPATYFVAAFTFSFVATTLIHPFFPEVFDGEDPPITGTYLLSFYIGILPLALIWRWQFRVAGYNLLENYVLLLYLLGHVAFVEVFITPFLWPLSRWYLDIGVFTTLVFAYFVVAGVGFYRQSLRTVALKLLLSFGIFIVLAVAVAILIDVLVGGTNST